MDDRTILVGQLADLMFTEYNAIAINFGISNFDSQEEIAGILEDNLETETVEELLRDVYARHALAGHIAALVMCTDLSGSVIIMSEDGLGNGISNETEDGDDGPKDPTTH